MENKTIGIVPNAVNELIRSRRTIKPELYGNREIDPKIVIDILENANWAPTHGLTEPWRFVIFAGESRQQLADFQSNWYKETVATELFKVRKYEKLQHRPLMAPYVIAICKKDTENPKIPELEDIEAVACAVQNMMLTATAYGVGSYWGSGGATYTLEMKQFLGLGEKDKCLGFLYLGYLADTEKRPVSRREPITDKVEWR